MVRVVGTVSLEHEHEHAFVELPFVTIYHIWRRERFAVHISHLTVHAYTDHSCICVTSLLPAFSEDSDPGGQFNVMAAGESGDFFPVRLGIEAGGRTPNSDGLQTFGGMLAVARYVKIEVVPSSGGSIVINEVNVRRHHLSVHPCVRVTFVTGADASYANKGST